MKRSVTHDNLGTPTVANSVKASSSVFSTPGCSPCSVTCSIPNSSELVKKNLYYINTPGSYINNPKIYTRMLEGFVYLRTLPYMKKSMNNKAYQAYQANQEQNKIKKTSSKFIKNLAKEFAYHKESLLLKDNLDENSKIINRALTDKQTISSYLSNLGKLKDSQLPHKKLSLFSMNSSFKTSKNVIQLNEKNYIERENYIESESEETHAYTKLDLLENQSPIKEEHKLCSNKEIGRVSDFVIKFIESESEIELIL